ncbi:MATE family efflux transporter [Butyrivibrio sp. VCB2001]|uniref:MATE family efflux transporter n=1 Tax=Butyrivibrio sp. VCB2001 TaxID=1280667 RepID=UPI0004045141|nr:MATE family efflux transporter [Butyrivibrio sp. VCB2001]
MNNKESLYRKIWVVALPIIFQNIIDASVNSADVLMLNYVGQDAISAVSLANSLVGILFMLLYGIGTGIAMLAAQYYGKGDLVTIEKIEGIGLKFSLSVAALGAFFCMTIPQKLMYIYTSDPVLIELGARYLRFIAPGLLFWAISAVYMAILRCIGRVGTSTVIETTALIVNVCLNAVFIFGLLGAPKLGVIGVAIATTLSRLIQLIFCIVVSISGAEVKLSLKPMFERHRLLEKDFFSMALPAIGNDLSWSLAFSMYSVIIGHLGNDMVAAYSITNVVRNLGTVFCFGMASATGIIVGQILGSGQRDEGIKAAHTLFRLTILAGILGGIVVALVMPFALTHASLTPQALDYLKFMLLISTYYIMGTAVNTCLIAGIFRAGGDSKFGFICDTIDMWCYAVPLGLLAAFVFKLPVKVVFFLLCTDEFVKWPWVLKHFYSHKWARNITRDEMD